MNAVLLLTKFLLAIQVVSSSDQCLRDSLEDIPFDVTFSCPPPLARTCLVDQDCPCPAVCRALCARNVCMQRTESDHTAGLGNWEPHYIIIPHNYSQPKGQFVDPSKITGHLLQVQGPTSTAIAYQNQPHLPSPLTTDPVRIIPRSAFQTSEIIGLPQSADIPFGRDLPETNVGEQILINAGLNQKLPGQQSILIANNDEIHIPVKSQGIAVVHRAEMPLVQDVSKAHGENEMKYNTALKKIDLMESEHRHKNDDFNPLESKTSANEPAQLHIEEVDNQNQSHPPSPLIANPISDFKISEVGLIGLPQSADIHVPLVRDLHEINGEGQTVLINAGVNQKLPDEQSILIPNNAEIHIATKSPAIVEDRSAEMPLVQDASKVLGENEVKYNTALKKMDLMESEHRNKNDDFNPLENKTSLNEAVQSHLEEVDNQNQSHPSSPSIANPVSDFKTAKVDIIGLPQSTDIPLVRDLPETNGEGQILINAGVNQKLPDQQTILIPDNAEIHIPTKISAIVEDRSAEMPLVQDVGLSKVLGENEMKYNTALKKIDLMESEHRHKNDDFNPLENKTSENEPGQSHLEEVENEKQSHPPSPLIADPVSVTPRSAFKTSDPKHLTQSAEMPHVQDVSKAHGENEMKYNAALKKIDLMESEHRHKNDDFDLLEKKTSLNEAAHLHLEEVDKTNTRNQSRHEAHDNKGNNPVDKVNTNSVPINATQTELEPFNTTLNEASSPLTKDFHRDPHVDMTFGKNMEQDVIDDLNLNKYGTVTNVSIQEKIPPKSALRDLVTQQNTPQTKLEGSTTITGTLIEAPLTLSEDFHSDPYVKMHLGEAATQAVIDELNSNQNDLLVHAQTNVNVPEKAKIPIEDLETSKVTPVEKNVDAVELEESHKPDLTHLLPVFKDVELPEIKPVLTLLTNSVDDLNAKDTPVPTFRSASEKTPNGNPITLLVSGKNFNKEKFPLLSELAERYPDLEETELLTNLRDIFREENESKNMKTTCNGGTDLLTNLNQLFSALPILKPLLNELSQSKDKPEITISDFDMNLKENEPGQTDSIDSVPVSNEVVKTAPDVHVAEASQDSSELEEVLKELRNKYPGLTSDVIEILKEIAEHVPGINYIDLIPIFKTLSQKNPGLRMESLVEIYEKIAEKIPADETPDFVHVFEEFLEHFPGAETSDMLPIFRKISKKYPGLRPSDLVPIFENIVRHYEKVSRNGSGLSVVNETVESFPANDASGRHKHILQQFLKIPPSELKLLLEKLPIKLSHEQAVSFSEAHYLLSKNGKESSSQDPSKKTTELKPEMLEVLREIAQHVPGTQATDLQPIFKRIIAEIPDMEPADLVPVFNDILQKTPIDETLDITHIFEELIKHLPEVKMTEILPILRRLTEYLPGMTPLQLLPLFAEVAKGKGVNIFPIPELKDDLTSAVPIVEKADHNEQSRLATGNNGPMEVSAYKRVLKHLLKKGLKNKGDVNNKSDQGSENSLLNRLRGTPFKRKEFHTKTGDHHTHIHLNIKHGDSTTLDST